MSKYFDTKNLTFMEPKVIENGNHMIMTNVHMNKKQNTLILIHGSNKSII